MEQASAKIAQLNGSTEAQVMPRAVSNSEAPPPSVSPSTASSLVERHALETVADPAAELRVIVKARVSDIPGGARARPFTLGNALSRQLLGRDCRFPMPNAFDVFDGMRIPPNCQSTLPLRRYFVYDFNVRGELDRAELARLPHRCFQASFQGEGM